MIYLIEIIWCLPSIQKDNAEILEFALLINLKHLTTIKGTYYNTEIKHQDQVLWFKHIIISKWKTQTIKIKSKPQNPIKNKPKF